jgi:hypothetical protein
VIDKKNRLDAVRPFKEFITISLPNGHSENLRTGDIIDVMKFVTKKETDNYEMQADNDGRLLARISLFGNIEGTNLTESLTAKTGGIIHARLPKYKGA